MLNLMQAITNDGFTFLWCFIIFVFFFKSLLSFFLKVKGVKKDLNSAIAILPTSDYKNKFKENYRGVIDKNLAANKTLDHFWNEFKEQLIKPKTLIDGKAQDERSSFFKNSIQPPDFFSLDKILGGSIDMRTVDSIPGKLTGLGILGTFLGLASGVYVATNLSGGFQDTSKLQESIGALLTGAGLAFWTSVCGILTSLIFSSLEKKTLSTLDRLVSTFNTVLEKCLIFQTKERIAELSLQELKKQTQHLEQFNEDLAINIGDVLADKMESSVLPQFKDLTKAVEKLHDIQQNSTESFFKEIADKMSGGLNSFADGQMDSLQDTFSNFKDTIPQLLNNLSKSQDDMRNVTQDIVQTFSKNADENQGKLEEKIYKLLEGMKQEFEGIGGSIKDQLSEVSNVANGQMRENLEMLGSGVRDINNEAYEHQNKINQDISNVFDSFSGTMNGFSENVTRINSLITNAQIQAESFKDVFPGIEQGFKHNEETSRNYKNSIESLSKVTSVLGDLSTTIKNYTESMGTNIGIMTNSNKETKDIWSTYEQRFSGIDEETAKWLLTIKSGLEDYGSTVNVQLKEIKNGTENIANSFAGAVENLREMLEDLDETLSNKRK